MEDWIEWMKEFEDALLSEQESDEPNDAMIRLLKSEIAHCKEMLDD